MQSLEQVLQNWSDNPRVQHDLAKQWERLKQHPTFMQWWQTHPHRSMEQLGPFLPKWSEVIKEQDNCKSCQGLSSCSNLMQGHFGEIIEYGNIIDISYSPCHYLTQQEKTLAQKNLVKSHHISSDIINSSLKDFDRSDQRRIDALNAVANFCLQAEPGQNGKGLYLYGGLGVGKSFLLGAACNKLAERGIESYMVYTPEFFREMKDAIAQQKVEEKLNAIKAVPVLVLDDIGAETLSAWARDEVLGVILQYRSVHKLPTLYTSNYDLAQLEEHLAYSQKGGIEQLKAKRIMERIRHYTTAVFVDGNNYRAI